MLRLISLGEVDLVDYERGTRLSAVIGQPKRMALLIFLTLESADRPIDRDSVLSVFWPEVDTVRGGKALNQAIYYLRRCIPGEWLERIAGDSFQVDHAAIWCDAIAFEHATQSGATQEAVNTYRGDFLKGFQSELPDFERWADLQTQRLRRKAIEATLRCAREAAANGNRFEAAALASRATSLEPHNEEITREHMRLLEQMGQYADAAQAYRDLVTYLRVEYDLPPSDETQELASTIAQRANSLNVEEMPDVRPAHLVKFAAAAPNQCRLRTRTASVLAMVATIALAIAIFSTSGLKFRPQVPPSSPTQVRIIIESSGDDSVLEARSKALESSILGELSHVDGISAHSSALSIAPPDLPSSRVFVARLAVIRSNSRLQVSVLLLDGFTGEAVTAMTTEERTDTFSSQSKISQQIAEFLRKSTGKSERERILASSGHPNARLLLQAHEDRIVGDYLRSSGSTEASQARFAAADSLLTIAMGHPELRAAAVEERAELSLARAWLHFFPPRVSIENYAKELRRAIALADSAMILSDRTAVALEIKGLSGYYLWLVGFANDGEKAKALELLKGAVRIAPARARAWTVLSTGLFADGDFVGARLAAERAYAADAFVEEAPQVLQQLFFSSLETGDAHSAKLWLTEMKRRFPSEWLPNYCELELIAWGGIANERSYKRAQQLVQSYKASDNAVPDVVARMQMVLGVIAARSARLEHGLNLQNAAMQLRVSSPEELIPLRAWLWAAVAQPDSTQRILASYVSRDPARRHAVARSARFAVANLK